MLMASLIACSGYIALGTALGTRIPASLACTHARAHHGAPLSPQVIALGNWIPASIAVASVLLALQVIALDCTRLHSAALDCT